MKPTEIITDENKPGTANRLSRRHFLCRSALAAVASVAFPYAGKSYPYVGKVLGANEKINVACIGVGGKGGSDSDSAARLGGNIVALCDVDENTLKGKAKRFPQAKLYQDYRKMLEEMDQSIDAVTVSTPDHHHAPAAVRAMRLGKHIYCQKPLTQSIYEARMMRKLTAEKNLATQMGNQGSAENGLRRAIEVIQAGVIGKPLELHVWSNRPIWPQGIERPEGEDPVPPSLDWNQWIGPAPMRPFKNGVYHGFKWRGWLDFGTGALGDMACHTVNMPFRALRLGYPNVIECEKTSGMNKETYPKSSRIRFEFPERDGLPPLKFWWYDGGWKPTREIINPVVDMFGADRIPGSGCYIVGSKGVIFSPDDYGAQFLIKLKDDQELRKGDNKHEALQDVQISIPRSPGHDQEWFRMMRTGEPAFSNFEIAAYLTETILLGCIAMRVGEGKRMEWDGPNMKSPNCPEAAQFVKRDYRKGFEV